MIRAATAVLIVAKITSRSMRGEDHAKKESELTGLLRRILLWTLKLRYWSAEENFRGQIKALADLK